MNSRWFNIALGCFAVVVVGLLILFFVLMSLAGVTFVSDAPTPIRATRQPGSGLPATWTPGPTPSPSATSTPAPTYTLVLPPGTSLPPLFYIPASPTPAANNPYAIVVATPTASLLKYPVAFDSQLNIITYTVSGKTSAELTQSLNSNSLQDPHEVTGRYYARTDWFINAHWNTKPTLAGCELDRADIGLVMTMTLPALVSTKNLAVGVFDQWDGFVQHTIQHESGHVTLSLQGAREYQRQVGNVLAARNCDMLDTQLKNLFDTNYKAIDRANTDYDKQTQHGLTQGAVFP